MPELAFATQSIPRASASSSIEALSPVFSHERNYFSFHTHDKGQRNLGLTGARLAGVRNALVGLYVTESTEHDYNPDPAQYGRVVALVRMLPMPLGNTMQLYPSRCMEFRHGKLVDRWPFGWPCEVVFLSQHGGPVLRDAVRFALGVHDYGGWAGQFLQGPINLRRLPALRKRLMLEVRNEIARDLSTQILPF